MREMCKGSRRRWIFGETTPSRFSVGASLHVMVLTEAERLQCDLSAGMQRNVTFL